MMKTMVRQAVPLQLTEVHSGADIDLQPMEDPMLEQEDVFWRKLEPVKGLCWSRLLPGTEAPGEKPTQEQIFWQVLWGPTLEQSIADRLHPM